MNSQSAKHESLSEVLQDLLNMAPKDQVPLSTIVHTLAGRGYPFLLIIFSLPFCVPILIPGVSTPFGLVMAFMGIRMSLGQHPWWPQWVLQKTVPYPTLEKLVQAVERIITKVQKYLHPRFDFIVFTPLFLRIHGLLICVLALLLALPLPIPFTNLLVAFPILFIALGLLEDDGLFIVLGYGLAAIGISAFIGLFYLGKAGLELLR